MKETKNFNEILLRRRNKLNIKSQLANEDNKVRVAIMLKNINSLGYTFSKELIEFMSKLSYLEIDEIYKELIPCLKEYVGANVVYEPMYKNFPECMSDGSITDFELYVNAIMHYISGGELYAAGEKYEEQERLPLFESSDLTLLDLGTDEDLDEVMNNLVSSKTSLSDTDKEDMITLIITRGVDYKKLPDEIPFKENVAIICKLIKDNTSQIIWFNCLHKYLKTATDILRYCVFESDGDISLAAPTKFRSFRRSERDLILHLLDECGNSLEEDMKRNTTAWIRLGEKLHPSEDRYEKYSNTVKTFDKLRNNGKIWTFNGKVEETIEKDDYNTVLRLLKTRPGEFARRLDQLLRKFGNRGHIDVLICDEFSGVANQISVPVLLQVKEHFAWRDEKNDSRVFFPKGQLSKCYTIANELSDIPKNVCDLVIGICEKAIIEQFKEKEPLGKVYIDESIKWFCVPWSQRSSSATGMRNITRGSRFGIKSDAKFIRLGIHWMNELFNGRENRTDIDLSCTFLDSNFGYMDHISYTHLRNEYCLHSGDLIDAPRSKGGSAEFVDISIDKALSKGVRYAAVQIYGYTQTKFCILDDMLFNWQEGIEQNCGDIFEASRVQHCVNLSGDTDCEIPVIFDLQNREIIWCDLALTTRKDFLRCVEGNVRGLSATAMGICQAHKPQMFDLGVLNSLARGEIVHSRNEADVIISNDTTKPIEIITKTIEVQNEKGEVIETRIETEDREKDVRFITTWDTDVWQGEML